MCQAPGLVMFFYICCMVVYVLIESFQNKWAILGQELTENNG
jgi:hypothetical protein